MWQANLLTLIVVKHQSSLNATLLAGCFICQCKWRGNLHGAPAPEVCRYNAQGKALLPAVLEAAANGGLCVLGCLQHKRMPRGKVVLVKYKGMSAVQLLFGPSD
jgi:hypothetical protein